MSKPAAAASSPTILTMALSQKKTLVKIVSLLIQNLAMFPSSSSLLSLYASFSTSLMLYRNLYNEIVPKKLEEFIKAKLKAYFAVPQKTIPCYDTFIIDSSWSGLSRNKLIDIARFYLSNKIGPEHKTIRIGKFSGQKDLIAGLVHGEEIVDTFQGIEVTWCLDVRKEGGRDEYFELCFEEKHRDKVYNEYIQHVIKTYKDMTKSDVERVLQLFSLTRNGGSWRSIEFHHSASFDTIAMDSDLKKSIVQDIDRFLTRRDYYRRIGKAWKRGYLLYGPPGTGKSSLIAAMANYLKYDIYNLELSDIHSDYQLRNILLEIDRQSIIVVEDIDCNLEVHDRSGSKSDDSGSDDSSDSDDHVTFSLSSLLNCVDGLWSSTLEERIIVFTTNHKEKLDPALLRPGRMDMHIHMSYCTTEGFRVLVSNYLEIKEHSLFKEIDELIQCVEATPASLAEEMMKSDDPDIALGEVIKFLNQKKIEKEEAEIETNSLT